MSKPQQQAQRHPTDLGVLGLSAVIAKLHGGDKGHTSPLPITMENFTVKDQIEFDTDPSGYSKKRREKSLDVYQLFRTKEFKAVAFTVLITSTLNYFSSNPFVRKWKWRVLLMALIWRFRAEPLHQANPINSPSYIPILGHLHHVHRAISNPHGQMYATACKVNFETHEMTIPGAHMINLFDARDREYVLRTNWRNFLKNQPGNMTSLEILLGEILGRGIFSTDGIEWFNHRKTASHMFSANALKLKMERVFKSHSEKFARALETKLHSEAFDLQDMLTSTVFDGFCEIAFGIDPKALEQVVETGRKPQFLISFDVVQTASVERLFSPPVLWQVSRMLNLGNERLIKDNVAILQEYVDGIVRARLEQMRGQGELNNDQDADLLSLYVDHARSNGSELDLEYLRDVILNFMVAGRDTTSCTLTNCFRFLSENPSAEKKLISEFKADVGMARHVDWVDAKNLSYGGAFFNEVIRIIPPVLNDVRTAIQDDVLPSGKIVKSGTQVITPNLALGHDPKLWAQPEEFTPERWQSFDEDGKGLPVRRPCEIVFPVFYAGNRLCLGNSMARLETLLFLKTVLVDSKLKIRVEPNQDFTKFVSGPVGFYKNGMFVRVVKDESE